MSNRYINTIKYTTVKFDGSRIGTNTIELLTDNSGYTRIVEMTLHKM